MFGKRRERENDGVRFHVFPVFCQDGVLIIHYSVGPCLATIETLQEKVQISPSPLLSWIGVSDLLSYSSSCHLQQQRRSCNVAVFGCANGEGTGSRLVHLPCEGITMRRSFLSRPFSPGFIVYPLSCRLAIRYFCYSGEGFRVAQVKYSGKLLFNSDM